MPDHPTWGVRLPRVKRPNAVTPLSATRRAGDLASLVRRPKQGNGVVPVKAQNPISGVLRGRRVPYPRLWTRSRQSGPAKGLTGANPEPAAAHVAGRPSRFPSPAMPAFQLRHSTTYAFSSPVTLSPHTALSAAAERPQADDAGLHASPSRRRPKWSGAAISTAIRSPSPISRARPRSSTSSASSASRPSRARESQRRLLLQTGTDAVLADREAHAVRPISTSRGRPADAAADMDQARRDRRAEGPV